MGGVAKCDDARTRYWSANGSPGFTAQASLPWQTVVFAKLKSAYGKNFTAELSNLINNKKSQFIFCGFAATKNAYQYPHTNRLAIDEINNCKFKYCFYCFYRFFDLLFLPFFYSMAKKNPAMKLGLFDCRLVRRDAIGAGRALPDQ